MMKTIWVWLAVVLSAANANAASYGPYPQETYQTCGASNAPVAVELVHGGAWVSGDNGASHTQALCRYLGANGIYVLVVNYRLAETAPWPAQLQDVQLGLRYLRAISIAKRIGVVGTSAGGHIALFMGETSGTIQFTSTDSIREASILSGISDRPDFVVDISGPTDLTDSELLPAAVPILIRGLGMSPLAARAFVSPIAHLTSDIPPIMISHGVQDTTVPVGQSDEFVHAAGRAGIQITSVNSGSSHAVASLSGITYDRHPGGHVFDVAAGVQSAMFRMIMLFAQGSQ